MRKLPQQLPLQAMTNQWASIIDPIIANPIVNGRIVSNVKLGIGTTVINHKLGRKLQGWFLVGIDGAATIYDDQSINQQPELTLVLTSDAAVTISIWVF